MSVGCDRFCGWAPTGAPRRVRAVFTSAAVLAASVAVAAAAVPEVTETGTQIRVGNGYYVAVLDRATGGALASLAAPTAGGALVTDLRIYTDFGLYPERGYVGTAEEGSPQVKVDRREGGVMVACRGQLRGASAVGHEPIPYRLAFRFDATPEVGVECEVVPPARAEPTAAFLAVCFAVPALSEWAAVTTDGVLRQDVGDGKQRDFESSSTPLSALRPDLGFITDGGTSVLLTGLQSDAPHDLQSVIIHGRAVFLAWLSGTPVTVQAVPHRVSFRLRLVAGDPLAGPGPRRE